MTVATVATENQNQSLAGHLRGQSPHEIGYEWLVLKGIGIAFGLGECGRVKKGLIRAVPRQNPVCLEVGGYGG